MFEKQERTGLIVKLYYNRDGKKLQSVGDVLYHSKKCRYVQLYVDSDKADQVMEDLKKNVMLKRSCLAISKIWIRILWVV